MPFDLLKVIVVDDEQPSREALINYLKEYCPETEVVAECNSANTAYKAIRKHKPHLVFLDIEMPRGSGFDLLKMFNPIDFKVVFVTAYSKYAVQAFRFSAVDYLLKPVKVRELKEAIAKVKTESTDYTHQNIEALLENLMASSGSRKNLVISDSKGFTVVKTSEIIMCEADGFCTHFFLTGNQKITSSKILKHYEEILCETRFMRVHHSYIVNIEHVKGYTNQGMIHMSEELSCPLSTSHKSTFLRRLRELK